MESQLPYEGEVVKLGGKEYVVPSLSLGQTKKLWPEFLNLNKTGVSIESFTSHLDTMLAIIHAAISRNYPDLTLEAVADLVSVKNAGELMVVVAKQSGFNERKPGEAKPVAVVQ